MPKDTVRSPMSPPEHLWEGQKDNMRLIPDSASLLCSHKKFLLRGDAQWEREKRVAKVRHRDRVSFSFLSPHTPPPTSCVETQSPEQEEDKHWQ